MRHHPLYGACFKVHEKSLLLPLMPTSLLSGFEPLLFAYSAVVGAFSMYPLLEKDGLTVPYLLLLPLYAWLASYVQVMLLWRVKTG